MSDESEQGKKNEEILQEYLDRIRGFLDIFQDGGDVEQVALRLQSELDKPDLSHDVHTSPETLLSLRVILQHLLQLLAVPNIFQSSHDTMDQVTQAHRIQFLKSSRVLLAFFRKFIHQLPNQLLEDALTSSAEGNDSEWNLSRKLLFILFGFTGRPSTLPEVKSSLTGTRWPKFCSAEELWNIQPEPESKGWDESYIPYDSTVEEDSWLSPETNHSACRSITYLETLNGYHSWIPEVLNSELSRYFAPHRLISSVSGRRLDRPLGGVTSVSNAFTEEGEGWKVGEGMVSGRVLLKCLKEIQEEHLFENLNRVVPPLLHLLDDYTLRYKFQGLLALSALLERFRSTTEKKKDEGARWLIRTGIGELFGQSLFKHLNFHNDPSHAAPLLASIRCHILLINLIYPSTNEEAGATNKTTPSEDENVSRKRFDSLCTLMADGVLSTLALSGEKIKLREAATIAAGEVMTELGMGSARWLKLILPELTGSLKSNLLSPVTKTAMQLHMKTCLALTLIIQACPVRMPRWTSLILTSCAQCWIKIQDSSDDLLVEADPGEQTRLETKLKGVLKALGDCCPEEIKTQRKQLIDVSGGKLDTLLML